MAGSILSDLGASPPSVPPILFLHLRYGFDFHVTIHLVLFTCSSHVVLHELGFFLAALCPYQA
jgi:hypothetical protein